MFDLTHTLLPFGLGKTVTHWICADKFILIELSDLIGFGYPRWTYKVLENWISILW